MTMENEKKLPTTAQELPDEEMDKVAGGASQRSILINTDYGIMKARKTYVNYEWRGTDDNKKYLCPRCHGPVHYTSWGRYRCDSCDESWFIESNLEMNMAGGWVCTGQSTVVTDVMPRRSGL